MRKRAEGEEERYRAKSVQEGRGDEWSEGVRRAKRGEGRRGRGEQLRDTDEEQE